MNAEDKAIELHDKYFQVFNELGFDTIPNSMAKNHALICIDEIINDSPNIYDSDRLNYKYWQEVKQEIQKL